MSRLITSEEFTKHLEEHFNIIIPANASGYTLDVDFGKDRVVNVNTKIILRRKKGFIKSNDSE